MQRTYDLLVLLLLLAVSGAALAQTPFDAFGRAGIDDRLGARIPLNTRVTTADGESVTLAELTAGKPIVLAPVLHDCPNICGVTLGGLRSAIANQQYRPGKDFQIVSFSIDPHEGPAQAALEMEKLSKTGNGKLVSTDAYHAVTADAGAIRAVTDALGYRYAFDSSIDQFAHVAAVAVLTSDGRLVRWLYGVAPQPNDLRLALTEAGEGKIGDFGDQLLLLCYHYDPTTGRYNSLVQTMLRVAGGLTVLVLAFFLGRALLRTRRAE